MGTNDESLIRIIVSRSEVDLVEIKQKFFDKYQKHLGKRVAVSSFSLSIYLPSPFSLFRCCYNQSHCLSRLFIGCFAPSPRPLFHQPCRFSLDTAMPQLILIF